MESNALSRRRFNEERYRGWPVLLPSDRERIKIILDLVGTAKKVLDLGCFEGRLAKALVRQGNTVLGVDISEKMVQETRRKGIEAIVTDLERPLPLATASFDVAVAGEIIEHIFSTSLFLAEVHRVLKPDGFLVLTTPNLAALGRRLLLLLGKDPLTEVDCLGEAAGHVRYFVKESLLDLLERTGFRVVFFGSDVFNLSSSGRVCSRFLAGIFPELGKTLIVKAQKL